MKFVLALLVALLCGLGHIAAIEEEEGVLVLTDDNFDDAIKEHKAILVEFYAPWCGHCKSLAPEYAKAAKALEDAPVKLAKVDATEEKGLASKFEIRGFPTLKWFKNGKPTEYSGGRTESEIVSWINKKVGPPAVTISSEEELLKLQEKHEAFAIGSFSKSDSKNYQAFIKLADESELDVTFAVTTDKKVQSKLGVTEDSVVVLKTFDEKRNELSVKEGVDADAVTEFVMGAIVPLVQVFSPEASKKIFGSTIKHHVLFFTDPAADYHDSVMSAYTTAAADFKGKLMFINVPNTEDRIMDFFQIDKTMLPIMMLADLSSESGIKKFPYTGESESKKIIAHVNDFLAGKLTPTLKSEEVADEDTTGDVVVLKGKSFQELVLDNEKDVLVEFYAPWCGHCKKLAPTWDELGANFKDNENIVIAKMDATANEIDVPGVNVKGFPTIIFFKGNDKSNPMKYDDARELDGFMAFLAKNAHHKASIPAPAGSDEL